MEISKDNPIIIDACILMVGISEASSEPEKYGFEVMREIYLDAVFDYFNKIIIHQVVFDELDEERKNLVRSFIGKNVQIVNCEDLYDKDPAYVRLFNEIAYSELFNFKGGKDKGEIYSLAYAAYNKINYFSTKDGSAALATKEIASLKKVEVVGFHRILYIGAKHFKKHGKMSTKEFSKVARSLYKKNCNWAIRKKLIPETFSKFILSLSE